MSEKVRAPLVKAAYDVCSEIRMYEVQTLFDYYARDKEGFQTSFSLARFRTNYGEGNQAGNVFARSTELEAGKSEWHSWVRDFPGDHDFWTLCNPEDIEQCEACRRRGSKVVCKSCSIPLCQQCIRIMRGQSDGGIPMSLCNDNHWGFTAELIYQFDARWIELAVAAPCWTTMLVCYVEGDRGHLMNEKFGQQRWRTRVKGSACTFQMPWEDIITDLQRNVDDSELADIPRSSECLKYMLRVQLKVGNVDFTKKLKQLYIRPWMVLRLLYYLIEQNHQVFRGKGRAIELKERMRAAVEREYPETEGHLPEEQREGHIPQSLLKMLREADEEKSREGPPVKRIRCGVNLGDEKNATPGPGAQAPENCLDNIRPVSVTNPIDWSCTQLVCICRCRDIKGEDKGHQKLRLTFE